MTAFSIKTKIVFIAAGIMFLSIGATILVSAHVFTREYSAALQARALVIGQGLKFKLDKILHLGLALDDITGLDEELREIVDRYEGIEHAMITNLDGKALFHSDPSQQGKISNDPLILRAIRSTKEIVTVCNEHGGGYDAIVPVFDVDGRHLAAIRIGFPLSLIEGKKKELALSSIGTGLLFLGSAMILLFWALNSFVTRPLSKLLAVMDRMREKGEIYADKVEIASRDEIGRLAFAFNRMTDELRKSTFTRKELERTVDERTSQLIEAQENLVRKEKLSILGQLAGSVGHELRNPLGVINNAVYFLKTVTPASDERVLEYLDIIKREVESSERIISDLLDFARTKTPRTTTIAAGELIRPALEKCAIPEGVAVELDIPGTLPSIEVDPMQMEQVFQNLITNAVQAMPGGGSLRVSAHNVSSPGFGASSLKPVAENQKLRTENVRLETDGDFVEISVTDTGEGISPENMKKLFQPLFTTKAKGIGLGLVVCKNLIEANGGRIGVESRVGEGTRFMIALPAGEK